MYVLVYCNCDKMSIEHKLFESKRDAIAELQIQYEVECLWENGSAVDSGYELEYAYLYTGNSKHIWKIINIPDAVPVVPDTENALLSPKQEVLV